MSNRAAGILACLWLLTPGAPAGADVTVEVGPTYIPRGDAQGQQDITVSNGVFAIAFAVETAPPWGVARGGIVDIAVIRDDEVGYDIASLADFLPNTWTNWPTSYQRVTIVEQSADKAVLSIERDWGEVQLQTIVTVNDGDSLVHLVTRMTNDGEQALVNIKSGYVMWPDGGSMFGIPGLHGVNAAAEDEALADWTAAYDENWLLGLHAPYANRVEYDGQDRYVEHDLAPGASRSFEAWLQVEDRGSLAALVQKEIELGQLGSGVLSGRVARNDGKAVDEPAVIVVRDGHPYAWTIGSKGRYSIELPTGDYSVYATAKGHARGAMQIVTIDRDERETLDFSDVAAPGIVHFQVTDTADKKPLDARVSIRSGPRPLIRFFGRATMFTGLDTPGELTAVIAPGDYEFAVSSGGGFVSRVEELQRTIAPGHTEEIDVGIALLAEPQAQGWYSADLHHHSDVLDGNTPAEYVMISELAARLDMIFLSDHDSVVNNARLQELADRRGIPFMAGTELSPSWAHFNAYPLDAGKQIAIDSGQSTVQEIFAEARRLGADVIEINHPYMGYGYFSSRDLEMIPGGYDNNFDLVELEAAFHEGGRERNLKTVAEVWSLWNAGERKYFAAGSDVHDVWAEESGAARTFVHAGGELSIDAFIDNLKKGRAYASQGPLVYPELLFGSEIAQPPGAPLVLNYSVHAVAGLASVQLVSNGVVVAEAAFDGSTTPVPVEFSPRPESDCWYSLVVTDTAGRMAYTNPVWVTMAR